MNRREVLGAALALFTSQVIPEPVREAIVVPGVDDFIFLANDGPVYLRRLMATVEITPEVMSMCSPHSRAFVDYCQRELSRVASEAVDAELGLFNVGLFR